MEALVAWLLVRVLCECLCVCVGDVREVAVGVEAFAIVEEVPAVHFAVEGARHLGEAEQLLFRFGVVLQLLSGFLGAALRRLAAAFLKERKFVLKFIYFHFFCLNVKILNQYELTVYDNRVLWGWSLSWCREASRSEP